MKILYAASNRESTISQLKRFLLSANPDHIIKIAAHQSIISDQIINWNLDALLDFQQPTKKSFDNKLFEIYYQQIKYFSPDLIVSDLEPFTSHIGSVLNIPVIQASSDFLYEGLSFLRQPNLLRLKIKYGALLFRSAEENGWFNNMLDNSALNLLSSHFCDLKDMPQLSSNFQFIRPYTVLGQSSIICKHNIVCKVKHNNAMLIKNLQEQPDAILFSDFIEEEYVNLILKDINNLTEYACNLFNCDIFVNQGIAGDLSDAFYNGKLSWIIPNFNDRELTINVLLAEYFKLGTILYDWKEIKSLPQIIPHYNNEIKFLHERLEEV